MKYCRGCGSELPDDAVFCSSCGRNVKDDETFRQNANQGAQNTYYNNVPNYPADKYSTMSIIGFIFAFIYPFVGLIISIIAYNETKTKFSPKSQSFAKSGIIISSVLLGLEALSVIVVCALVGAGIIAWGNYWIAALALV